MLAELDDWRKNVINDQGVSDEFRALGVFPAECPTSTVDEWITANSDSYDFNKVGWPSWYPTRTLEEWKKVRALWEPFVMCKPGVPVEPPSISQSKRQKPKKKKATKFEKSKRFFSTED